MKPAFSRLHENVSTRQIAVLVLSLYMLGTVLVETFLDLPPATDKLLHWIDFPVCLFFLYDFSVRFYQAPSKWKFMKWGWIDLLSSIPLLTVFHLGRVVRVLEIIRILRGFRSSRILVRYLFKNPRKSTITTIALASMILVIFSSIAVLSLENHPNSNIKTPSDAIWWSFVTMSTVGYGDHYPITTAGRMLAVILVVAGVALFGTFTGLVSSFLLEAGQKKEEKELSELIREIRALREKVESLEQEIRQTGPGKADETAGARKSSPEAVPERKYTASNIL